MNEVIKQLYTIEERAGQIMENTQVYKKGIKQKQKEQEELIEQELLHEMDGRRTILKSGIEEKAEQEIQEIIQKNQRALEELEREYDGNYEEKAQEILKRITEV